MPFTLAPQKIPRDYEFKGKYFHFTYPTHVPFQLLHEAAARATSVRKIGYSFVHEHSQPAGETYAYAHTHAAWIMEAPINVKGSHKFDVFVPDDDTGLVDQLHPNVQPKVTLKAMEQVFASYHAGRKFDIETGKYKFIKPINHEYKLPEMFCFNQSIIREMLAAPTLVDAVIAGEVRPRTVMDVKALRDENAGIAAKRFKHKFSKESFNDLMEGIPWNCLHVWGPTNLGKTKWALAQFDNPCIIKPFNSIGGLEAIKKRFDPKLHDGLVLDEADLTFMTREMAIAFLDMDEPFSCSVRFTEFELEPCKKIIISNPDPIKLYPSDPAGAIARRIHVLHVTTKTYKSPNVIMCTPLQPLQQQQPLLTQPTQHVNAFTPVGQYGSNGVVSSIPLQPF